MKWTRVLALTLFALAPFAASATYAANPTPGASVRKHTHHGGPRARGIDVSEWESPIQGRRTCDFGQVKRAGYSFAIARVSYGQFHEDQSFSAYYAAIKRHGLVRGAYQYFRPNQDAAAQANLFCRKVGRILPGDLPPMLDVEEMGGVSSSFLAHQIRTWASIVRARLGIKPMIYTAPGLWNGYGVNFGSLDLWVADYGPSTPVLPNGWSSWVIFQYTDKENVPGVGPCDANVFHGTVLDLRNYVGLGTKTKTKARPRPTTPPAPPTTVTQPTLTLSIQDTARFVKVTGNTNLVPGKYAKVTVSYLNTGTEIWRPSRTHLVDQSQPRHVFKCTVTRETKPMETGTFSFHVRMRAGTASHTKILQSLALRDNGNVVGSSTAVVTFEAR